jgi:hypothetical protein
MARYLLVAHQTAESPEFLNAACDLAKSDPDATFTILVPATPVPHLLYWEERETLAAAREQASKASIRLKAVGCRVTEARIGDRDPVLAVEDELRRRTYHAIVISTFPVGWSRWLRLGVIHRLRRSFPNHTLIHVIASAQAAARSLAR